MRQPHQMVKHTQTIRRLLPTNYLSVFDNFVGLSLKGLDYIKSLRNNFADLRQAHPIH